MLLSLRLKDFVIVDALEIDFAGGFTVLTGETGAGKSILLDALQLALGGRGDAGVLREGAARTEIHAEFRCPAPLQAWLEKRELAGDPGVLLLRRVIDADGRSRAFVNGHPATVALLREAGEQLVDIHGQHAAQSLLRPDGQRLLLDAFAGLETSVSELARQHANWRDVRRLLDQAEHQSRDLELERERLQWQRDALEACALGPGEWEQLCAEQSTLSHAASLLEGAQSTLEALSGDDEAVTTRLQQCLQRLRPLERIDPRLREAVALLESAAIEVDEAASALGHYTDRVELDPSRLAEVEARVAAVFDTARRLRLSPEELPAERDRCEARLAELQRSSDLAALRAELQAAQDRYHALAGRLRAARQDAARRLADGVSALIADLGMAGGRFEIALHEAEPSASGTERIEFLVSGHAGSSPRPLARVASGGELSRVGLAIAVLAAQANPVPTLIFDEADAGIGGGVAEVVGALMRRLGESRQVLCVTHLPQVAAQAHQQVAVRKAEQDGRTVTRLHPLDRNARVDEIARMLGGLDITATTRKHARELLSRA